MHDKKHKKPLISCYLDADGYIQGFGNFPADGSVKLEDLPNLEHNHTCYKYIDGKFILDEEKANKYNAARKVEEIRFRRQRECFSVVDRPLWLDGLSITRMAELKQWYKAWLDAPNTGVIPEKPEWLED